MELLLDVLAEGSPLYRLRAGVRSLRSLKEVLIETYVHGFAIDLHAGDVAFDRDDLRAILVFFSEIAKGVLAAGCA